MSVSTPTRSLQCWHCASELIFYERKTDTRNLRCDICQAGIPGFTETFSCNKNHLHSPLDSFDVCMSCARSQPQDKLTFSFPRWLLERGGKEWIEEVYVKTMNQKIAYGVVPVTWEDVDRKAKSCYGAMIFDVAIRLKKTKEIRYVIRPDNVSDVVQPRAASAMTLPIGQVVSKPLHAVTLKDLLSKTEFLKECGLNCEIKGGLYEPLMDEISEGEDRKKQGGIAFSVGCALLSEEDLDKPYGLEVYQYPSVEYPDAKCVAIVQTIDGTTATLVETGKYQTLEFAKDGKSCHWKIAPFDTSTTEGKRAKATGCDVATDMQIFFVPVMEDNPLAEVRYKRQRYLESCNEDTSLEALRPKSCSISKGGLSFGRHKMEVTKEDFKGISTTYPLKRIRNLPIRAFLRGGLVFDQFGPLTRVHACVLSGYLQTKYLDEETASIWGFTVQARARAKLLPIYNADQIFPADTYNNEYTAFALENKQNCVICISYPISQVLLNCGHMCMCTKCPEKWKTTCPLCRAKIIEFQPEHRVNKKKVKIIPEGVPEN